MVLLYSIFAFVGAGHIRPSALQINSILWAGWDNFTRPKRAVEVEAALKEVTGSEVHVEYKDGKGSLKIDFYSDDMLQKFVSLLGMYDPEG